MGGATGSKWKIKGESDCAGTRDTTRQESTKKQEETYEVHNKKWTCHLHFMKIAAVESVEINGGSNQ